MKDNKRNTMRCSKYIYKQKDNLEYYVSMCSRRTVVCLLMMIVCCMSYLKFEVSLFKLKSVRDRMCTLNGVTNKPNNLSPHSQNILVFSRLLFFSYGLTSDFLQLLLRCFVPGCVNKIFDHICPCCVFQIVSLPSK